MKTRASCSTLANRLFRFLVGLAFAGLTHTVAAQIYLGTVFTGLYSTPGESGSGVTATHEEPVIFLTFYVYRSDRSAYWLTATVARAPDVNGSFNYTGDLYETSGPPLGGPFDPATVTYRKVGTVSWLSRDAYTVALNYTVDGVMISKNLTRFTLNNLNFAGTYLGTIAYQTANCSPPSLNGRTFAQGGNMTITQAPNALTAVVQGSTTCTLAGDYMQRGSWGNSTGNFSCSDGTAGPMVMVAMQMTVAGFTAQFAVNTAQCQLQGSLSGIFRTGP
jgi:hypothetical protein